MALESENTWTTEFSTLPKVSDNSWIDNLLDYLEGRVNSNLKLIGYLPEDGNSFTLNRAIIRASIEQSNSETGDLVSTLATGIKNSVLQTGTLAVQSGSYIEVSSPATTFSSVSNSVIDPPSSILLENKILELLNSEPVEDANASEFPIKIRSAFLLLTAIIVGTNSVTPTPSPILDIGRGLE